MTDKNDDDGAAVARRRFTVELRPGETTIVSWKKLIKDSATAGKASGEVSASSSIPTVPVTAVAPKLLLLPPPLTASHSMLESRLAPGQPGENELKDGHPSRFGAVIEKIERLYMGKHSSDEEDLNDVPDDDEYDTGDSFIDDAELDDYFQVDNSAIKHDGFFVNRGILERKNEPTALPSEQPKKRRRKDLVNTNGDGTDGELPNKLVKVGNKAAGKSKKSVGRNIVIPHVVALPSPCAHKEEIKFQNQATTTVICAKRKSAEIKTSLAQTISSSVSKGDAVFSTPGKVDQQIPERLPSKKGNKTRDGIQLPNTLVLKSQDKTVSAQSKSEPAILSNSNGVLDQFVGHHERPALNVSAGKIAKKNGKALVMEKKEGSSVKPKSEILEKTIGELEKMVAESRPPSTEVQDDETSQGAGKKRLPREVKLKLAKVARLAQASYGRIPDELVNRLMSILGHLIQVRTLKRNLKDMVTMGLTAEREKDDRVQQMMKDVAELITMRVPYIESKILEFLPGGTVDYRELPIAERNMIKKSYFMDDAIEDKIHELYEFYVDCMDEDAGVQARKLYAELAQLWPEGFMDNHGIKRGICRSLERKRNLYGRSKDQEKIKKKQLVGKTEGTVRVGTTTVAQPQHMQQKPVSEPNTHGLASANKPVSNTTSTNPSVRLASSFPNAPNPVHPKQEKVKGKGGSISLKEKVQMDVLAKKKMKRKPETEPVGSQSRLEKPVNIPGDEKAKSHKQVVGPVQKPSVSFSPPITLNNPTDKIAPF